MLALTYSLPEKAEANTATTNKLMTKDTSRAMAVGVGLGIVGLCGWGCVGLIMKDNSRAMAEGVGLGIVGLCGWGCGVNNEGN